MRRLSRRNSSRDGHRQATVSERHVQRARVGRGARPAPTLSGDGGLARYPVRIDGREPRLIKYPRWQPGGTAHSSRHLPCPVRERVERGKAEAMIGTLQAELTELRAESRKALDTVTAWVER